MTKRSLAQSYLENAPEWRRLCDVLGRDQLAGIARAVVASAPT